MTAGNAGISGPIVAWVLLLFAITGLGGLPLIQHPGIGGNCRRCKARRISLST